MEVDESLQDQCWGLDLGLLGDRFLVVGYPEGWRLVPRRWPRWHLAFGRQRSRMFLAHSFPGQTGIVRRLDQIVGPVRMDPIPNTQNFYVC